MHAFATNNRSRSGGGYHQPPRWQLVDVGFFVHGLPRLIPLCRLLGHRPVVDGTEPSRIGISGALTQYLWVVCDRCGVGSTPQGTLDPSLHQIGDRYLGPWGDPLPEHEPARRHAVENLEQAGFRAPGPIERRPEGRIGGQLIVGPSASGRVGWRVKVGHEGSEQTLAGSINLGWLGALYLHTEGYGTWLQRRLNSTGDQSRVIGFEIATDGLNWQLWARRYDSRNAADPWWVAGSIRPRLTDRVLGKFRHEHTNVPGGQLIRFVRMPESDYLVQLRLERVASGRERLRKKMSWSVDWDTLGPAIPTKSPGRGRVHGGGVTVPDRAVRTGTWPAEAVAAIAAQMASQRTLHGWEPICATPIPVSVAA